MNASFHCNLRFVVLMFCRMFWSERKLAKARDWFMKTVKLDPDFGDAWAYFFRFETMNGSDEQRDDVVKHCVNAEPRHGELWCSVSKDIKNWRLKTDEILPLAAEKASPPQ